jgi:UDP-N-acetylglucosamine 1-carboxyvinyltransferase
LLTRAIATEHTDDVPSARVESNADHEGDRIVVRQSGPLSGTVTPSGAKNSVLKLIAATLLAPGTYELSNVPGISDVATMASLVEHMGVKWSFAPGRTDHLTLTTPDVIEPEAPYELAEAIRASVSVLGPLLARCGEARVSLPGGDDFGTRPIDIHLRGLEALGAEIELRHGVLYASAPRGLHGAETTFEFPSVGATENVVMAAICAKGRSVIDNVAKEPEITDLLHMLADMGAQISGIGTGTLVIEGVTPSDLHAVHHRVIPDRLEVATFLSSVACAGGEITINGARPDHMELFLAKVAQMGVTVTDTGTGIFACNDGNIRSVDVATLPYPGIATDYKPLIVIMLALGDGVGIVTENLYAGRFRYTEELARMGADIRTEGHHAVVRGVPKLQGAPVKAHDIRAGACLVVAGLAAEGETVIANPWHIDRGYTDLVGKLKSLGALIERV